MAEYEKTPATAHHLSIKQQSIRLNNVHLCMVNMEYAQ